MAWLSTLVLVLAVSLDSLGVGFAYGLKKLAVPPVSLVPVSYTHLDVYKRQGIDAG